MGKKKHVYPARQRIALSFEEIRFTMLGRDLNHLNERQQAALEVTLRREIAQFVKVWRPQLAARRIFVTAQRSC